jgi:hypothetical protein
MALRRSSGQRHNRGHLQKRDVGRRWRIEDGVVLDAAGDDVTGRTPNRLLSASCRAAKTSLAFRAPRSFASFWTRVNQDNSAFVTRTYTPAEPKFILTKRLCIVQLSSFNHRDYDRRRNASV